MAKNRRLLLRSERSSAVRSGEVSREGLLKSVGGLSEDVLAAPDPFLVAGLGGDERGVQRPVNRVSSQVTAEYLDGSIQLRLPDGGVTTESPRTNLR